MRRTFAALAVLLSLSALAQDKHVKDVDLKKGATTIDTSLAGDLTRKKAVHEAAPTLQYDQFRLGVETQVFSKLEEQIASLKKILKLTPPEDKDRADLLFRLGELYFEASKHFFFDANRKDDQYITAMNAGDSKGMSKAKDEKERLLLQSKQYSKQAVEQYSEIIQHYKDYERTDEVLYFLGHNLMEEGEDRKALIAYKRMLDKYPKSKFVSDAWLAFGEYYFNGSKGKRESLQKALEAYRRAAEHPENQVYGFAIYKQGWCFYNLGDYVQAMDRFKAVVLYGDFVGAQNVEKDAGKSGKNTLIREARNDYVRSYAQIGSPADAKADFGKVTSKPDERFLMMKQLADLYYGDGKDREAALTYNMLIKEKPLSPEAPGFQGRIVDCVLRAGNKRQTVEQVRRLVKIMQDVEKSGVIKEDKDKQALRDAKDMAERTLSNLAVTWHNEAKKTRDDDTLGLANEVYSDYLTLFAENPKAYDLRFFWAELLNDNLQKYADAADQYSKVFLQDIGRIQQHQKPGKWMVNAAYDAVLAYDEVVKKAEESGQIKVETPSGDSTQPLNIPPPKQALLDACDRYLKYVSTGDKTVEIAFKAANILYRYNHFDEAVLRFSEIALHHTDYKFENGERASEIAANLILDSYNLLGNWTKVNEWARRFYNSDKLATGKFREDLSRVIEQSSFKLVNQLEAKKEFGKAARAEYLNFVSEFPRSEIADKALFNASIDFFNAKSLDKAMQTRQKIFEKYPKSEYVPACVYANAEGHEAVGDFEEAASAYEAYVRGYEKAQDSDASAKEKEAHAKAKHNKKNKKGKKESEVAEKPQVKQLWEASKAQIALYNAGIFREGLLQSRQALKDREHYLELWPDAKDAEAVFLSIVDLYEKMSNYGKAISQLEDYEKKYGKDPNKMLNAEGRIADFFEKKLRRAKESDRLHARILRYYQDLPARQKKALDNTAVDAVARANYLKNEEDFRFYASLRLKCGRPNPAKDFKAGFQEKMKRLKVVEEDYTKTVEFKAGDPAICALYKIGLAYDDLANAMINAPMPRGAAQELQDAIHDEVSNQANAPKAKAADAFLTAVQKSRELDIHNDCATKSLKLLRDTYKPDEFPTMLEETAELKGSKPLLNGEDVLQALQPIPRVVLAGVSTSSPALRESAVPVKPDAPVANETPTAEPEPEPSAPPAKTQAAAPAPAPDTAKSGGSEEPQDDLK